MTEYPWDKIGRISWEIDRNCLCTTRNACLWRILKKLQRH